MQRKFPVRLSLLVLLLILTLIIAYVYGGQGMLISGLQGGIISLFVFGGAFALYKSHKVTRVKHLSIITALGGWVLLSAFCIIKFKVTPDTPKFWMIPALSMIFGLVHGGLVYRMFKEAKKVEAPQ
jgi:peptidoglycan/LPS O-acetylase OafA/YrhL